MTEDELEVAGGGPAGVSSERIFPDMVTLDPDAVAEKLADATRQVVDAAVTMVRSAPYGIIPDPAHVAIVRDAVKRLELVYGEMEVTAKLIQLADSTDAPKDIQTEGL